MWDRTGAKGGGDLKKRCKETDKVTGTKKKKKEAKR